MTHEAGFMDDDDDLEGDLSPITILLIGSIIALAVFFTVKRLVDVSADAKLPKFRRRTRAEEEAILEALQRRQEAVPHDAGDNEDGRAEVEAVETEESDNDNEEADEEDDQGSEAAEADGKPRALTKKELHKIEKRKQKEEQQEARRHMLERDRKLRELREAEEREREEYERQLAADRAAKSKSPARPVVEYVSETALLEFIESTPSTLISRDTILKHFSRASVDQVMDQVRQLGQRAQNENKLLALSDGSVLKMNPGLMDKIAEQIRRDGSLSLEAVANLALSTQVGT